MDLKDVIADLDRTAKEAHNAFHAGHHDVAENYLMEQMLETCAYFDGKITLPEHVTKSATNETPPAEQSEKPAEVPGAQVRPAAVVHDADVQQAGHVPESLKQTR